MRVSTPSEMTDINPLILSDIVCMFETELHSKPKNLNKYEILINFSDYYKCDSINAKIFDEIVKMYVSSGWNSKTNIKYKVNLPIAILVLYK